MNSPTCKFHVCCARYVALRAIGTKLENFTLKINKNVRGILVWEVLSRLLFVKTKNDILFRSSREEFCNCSFVIRWNERILNKTIPADILQHLEKLFHSKFKERFSINIKYQSKWGHFQIAELFNKFINLFGTIWVLNSSQGLILLQALNAAV